MSDLISRQSWRMNDWMIFSERLSEQIKKQNLSIRQLAEKMGMSPTTIFRYAKGQRVPRASEILKASDALGVTCDYLLGLSDDPKKTSSPSAQPNACENTCEIERKSNDLISRADAVDAISKIKRTDNWQAAVSMALMDLPSAQPERKKGKWIYNSPVTMKCDQCGLVIKDWDWHRFKYCPNCCSDMRGERE